jgi:hypothetical protein
MEREDRKIPGALPPGIALLETLALALASTAFWYFCYYLLAPWIWRQNIPFRPEDITPWIRSWTKEHDGVEIYALYILVFLNIVSTMALSGLVGRISAPGRRRAAIAVAAVISLGYCAAIGFIPPMTSLPDTALTTAILQILFISALTASGIALLCSLHQHSPRLALAVAALLLVPPCFLAVSNYGWSDYTYVYAPALRLLQGVAPSQIYFQYDLLPSLLAAAWMKLGLDLNDFRVVGQAGYYVALAAVFLLSSKLFRRKELAYFLLAALVLGRIYASPFDATLCFQTTPVRLDLWLPLLLVVYRMGPYHWSAGLTCGLLLLLVKNFGIIYSLAYLQLLMTLWLLRYLDTESRGPLLESLTGHARRCLAPVAIIVCSGLGSYFLFHNSEYGNFAGYYQKIGIGFMQISRSSFYWYVPALFGVVLMLLFKLRNQLSPTYLTVGLLLTYCAIGNSVYFFGRSHENNIINIAIVLLFLFFLMLDLAARYLGEEAGSGGTGSFFRKHGTVAAASVLIFGIVVSYSDSISKKGIIQYLNAVNGQISYTAITPENYEDYFAKVRQATGNSRKLFFLHESDFALYYYGGYAQVGYCNPFRSWIFTKDLHRYLQSLLDGGYYVVCSPKLKEQLDGLNYNYNATAGETTVVAKLPGKTGTTTTAVSH